MIILLALVLVCLALLWILHPLLRPQTCYVDPERGNDLTGRRGNSEKPFRSIQAALDAMKSGDTVLLGPGYHAVTTSLILPPFAKIDIRGSATPEGFTTEWEDE